MIGCSAFAGCYKAKNITIPSSVTEIQPNAFDEGYSFQSDISLPEHLYCYILRLPVGSTINKKSRLSVLKKIYQDDINEDPEIIERQKNDLEKMLEKFNVLQIPKKADSRAEMKIMYEMLNKNSVNTENIFSSE
ncbi:hypothetical protein SDC9_177335 [bioreactor metagenome]|uniref:Uncharacterized protein n=1 Tax=bioreactor metagenome TaxID=1076179 RepID=A0A645GV46_9ZZZZ